MKTILVLFTTLFFIGCNSSQPCPKNNHVKKVENVKPKIKKEQPKEEYKKIISYQDIIVKINDINTNKKTNKRVKNIVKEYQYNVSDDDSKNSARKKALTQVKILILEEIGVFVESYLELSTVVENKKYQKYFKQEIKNLTAGIIKTKIIDEKFDGKSYYVKASVLVDPDSVSEGISEILKIKANKSEITKLNKLLETKEHEIDIRSNETISLQKKIANQLLLNQAKAEEFKLMQINAKKQLQKKISKQLLLNQVKAKELKLIQNKLIIAERQLQKYNIEENRIRTKLDRIRNIIIEDENNAYNKLMSGMTPIEVKSLIGKPRATSEGNYNKVQCYNYGRIWVVFNTRILSGWVHNRDYAEHGCRATTWRYPINKFANE